jgi:carboxyl-terminal processing protease
MKNSIIICILFLLIFSSCRKDDPPTVPTTVTPAMARDTLYYIMKQWYYWFDKMPSVTKENYADPYALMEAMRYKELDRWSFVADYDDFNAQMEGTFVGHGFRIGVDGAGNARIAMIYNSSPLYVEGVRRGWIVKKINDTEIAPILISGDGEAYSNLIGPGTAGITNKFLFQLPDGSEVTVNSTKKSFTINSVLSFDTLHLSSGVTGHLVFESFIEPSEAELATAFAFFKANNVKDLILDLRYNSGGYLYVAQTLASYILGNGHKGDVFAKLQYNSKNPSYNTTFAYETTASPLALSKLVVITTRSTASASEAVMNGLKSYINVISVGDTTNGKPTGMNGWPCAKKYYYWPVTFKMVNSADQGDYFGGIIPAKLASDDITHDFDDRNELCLKQAISYLQTGSFSTKGSEEFVRHPQVSEKPSWMNNTFIPAKQE